MKKILLILLSFLTFGFSGTWEKILSFTDKEVKSISYDVEAKGWNFRVYEFVPINAQDKLCIVVTSDAKGMQLECFKRTKVTGE